MCICQLCLNYWCQKLGTWGMNTFISIWMPWGKFIWWLYSILEQQETSVHPPNIDPYETNFKIGGMVLLKNHTPTTTLDVKYSTSHWICKQLSDKAFDIKDSSGKVRHASIRHLQLLYLTEQVLLQLPDITLFGCTTKYFKHPN